MASTKTKLDPIAKRYLDEVSAPSKRGRKPVDDDLDKLKSRLDEMEISLNQDDMDVMARLHTQQRCIDYRARIEELEEADTFEDLEAAFIAHAGSYAEANGISAKAFRAVGVPARVLREAGIK